MNIETKEEEGILVIKPLEKSIEAANSRDFKTKVNELINQGNKILILNLSKVEFMDSSGLGSLISILKLLANFQGKMTICEVQDQVTRVFSLTRLDQVFKLFSNEKDATSFLKNPTQ